MLKVRIVARATHQGPLDSTIPPAHYLSLPSSPTLFTLLKPVLAWLRPISKCMVFTILVCAIVIITLSAQLYLARDSNSAAIKAHETNVANIERRHQQALDHSAVMRDSDRVIAKAERRSSDLAAIHEDKLKSKIAKLKADLELAKEEAKLAKDEAKLAKDQLKVAESRIPSCPNPLFRLRNIFQRRRK